MLCRTQQRHLRAPLFPWVCRCHSFMLLSQTLQLSSRGFSTTAGAVPSSVYPQGLSSPEGETPLYLLIFCLRLLTSHVTSLIHRQATNSGLSNQDPAQCVSRARDGCVTRIRDYKCLVHSVCPEFCICRDGFKPSVTA